MDGRSMRDRLLAVAMILVVATDAEAGVIRGRLRLGSHPSVATPGTVVEAAGVEQAVVWVDPVPESVARRYRPGPKKRRVVQTNRTFAPLVTTVMVGSTVDF